MKPRRLRLLFLQLPRLDPDVDSPGENLRLAAACLGAALGRSDERSHWTLLEEGPELDALADHAVVEALAAQRPDVVGATCYLWNIERSLHVLRQLKRRLPNVRIMLGGPEVAREHPLLFRRDCPADALVLGEGEAVLPALLRSLRLRRDVDLASVAVREAPTRWRWGVAPRPVRPLSELLPPPKASCNRPDAHGMAYLETSRGCPLRCAFCCYNLRRAEWSAIPPDEVFERVRVLVARGAREIRLVDPTFNAHARFDEVVAALARANPRRRVRFFVELRADTLTDSQARALAEAGVAEAEVGVQSTDPEVLRVIRRGTRTAATLQGIERLRRHGIRPTVDFMWALPRQDRDDLERSLAWLERFPEAHPQFLPLLLLPGTELRDRAAELGLVAQRLPPYRVTRTDRLSSRALRAVEQAAADRLGGFDTPTRRFAGRRLPDLFPAPIRVQLDDALAALPPARANRQAIVLGGADLYARREQLARLVREAIRTEPHLLWQFVLEPVAEEPLEVLDRLLSELRRRPAHWLDRLVAPTGQRILAARRLFVRPARGASVRHEWLDACDTLLASVSH